MDQVTLKNLKIDEEEVDGIHFHIEDDAGEDIKWNFTIMKLNQEEDRKFEKHSLGYKYQIVLYNDETTAEVFEAILGDLQYHVKNYINLNIEGFILKKSKKSEEILEKIFKNKLLNILNNVIEKNKVEMA